MRGHKPGFRIGALRRAGAALLFLLPLSVGGCGGLPPRAPSGEPFGVNPHVRSVRIDPRTLKPIEQEKDKAPEGKAPKKLAE